MRSNVSVPTLCQQLEHFISMNESTNKHAQKRNTQAELGDTGLGYKLELTHDGDSGCPATNSLLGALPWLTTLSAAFEEQFSSSLS